MKKLIGSEVDLPPELREGYFQSKREWEARHTKLILIVTVCVATYYIFASGVDTPAHIFVRANNIVTVFFLFVAFALRVGLRDNVFPACLISSLARMEKVVIFISAGHYAVLVAMTWDRVAVLLNQVFGFPVYHVPDSLGEAYCVLWNILAIFCCAFFHVLPTNGLLLFSFFSPLQWALQCWILGTDLRRESWMQLCGVYLAVCLLGFLGGRRCNLDHLNSYVRLHLERGQVMHIFRHASVPIFSVGQRQDGSREIQVELWNTALEELTQSSVSCGTPLRSVSCLRASTASVLITAIERALDDNEGAGRTTRKLVPLISAAGVVWLQVDVWPVGDDGTKAIIIGSDVTEFVARHQSLLHFVPEDGLGQQHRDRPTPDASQGNCVAQLDPHALTVLDCTPQFNILMQCRMRGRPFLDHVNSREHQRAVRQAVEATFSGRPPQMVVVELRLCPESPTSRQQQHFPATARKGHHRHKSPANNFRRVVLKISLIVEEVLLQLEVLSEQGKSSVDDDGFLSDPGAADNVTLSQDNLDESGYTEESNDAMDVVKSLSEPTRTKVRVNNDELDSLLMNSPRACESGHLTPRAPPQAERLDTGELEMEAVVIHLIDLSRHFHLETFEKSFCYLQIALQRITANKSRSVGRWGKPCESWQCTFCRAWNDEEEDCCEVCKLGEPGAADSNSLDNPSSRTGSDRPRTKNVQRL